MAHWAKTVRRALGVTITNWVRDEAHSAPGEQLRTVFRFTRFHRFSWDLTEWSRSTAGRRGACESQARVSGGRTGYRYPISRQTLVLARCILASQPVRVRPQVYKLHPFFAMTAHPHILTFALYLHYGLYALLT